MNKYDKMRLKEMVKEMTFSALMNNLAALLIDATQKEEWLWEFRFMWARHCETRGSRFE